jgi:E3 ubiquitin-protein ligase BRE1
VGVLIIVILFLLILRQGSKSPVLTQGNGGYNPTEFEIIQEQLKSREMRIIGLERELAAIRDDKTIVEAEVRWFHETLISSSLKQPF